MTTKTSETDTPAVTFHERRQVVAKLYARHQKAPAIHRALLDQGVNCDIRQIYRDIDLIMAMWQKELVTDPVALKAREWSEIEEAESECWLSYAATGDVRWLTELRGWKERKAKLLGLDYPIKVDQRVLNFTIEFDRPNQAIESAI